MKATRILLPALALSALAYRPAGASFHLMQIHEVIGGVNGQTSIQAVQLRMRAVGQSFVSNGRLVVRDATGNNPVVLIAFPTNVTNSGAGVTVLAATSGFAAATTPSLTPDFIFTNPIPNSYLAAGTLTFEDNFGTVLWRLSWGGSAYTGPGTGSLTNDADGNFNPPYSGPLPSTTAQALLFQGSATALSTNNAADYALTAGAATFTNNAGASGTINSAVSVGDGAPGGELALEAPAPNPVRGAMSYAVILPRTMRVELRLLDLQGRPVRDLASGIMAAGRHDFTWAAWDRRGAALASGIYFLELTGDGVHRARRFVLLD